MEARVPSDEPPSMGKWMRGISVMVLAMESPETDPLSGSSGPLGTKVGDVAASELALRLLRNAINTRSRRTTRNTTPPTAPPMIAP